jgi:hypothetical protein
LEFEEKDAGQKVVCPHCGAETYLLLPMKRSSSAQAIPTPLQKLRNESAYSSGRSAFWVLYAATMLTAVIGFFSCVFGLFNTSDNAYLLIGLVACVLSAITAWTVWEISQAIFDMADCALSRQNEPEKKKEDSN